jgi:two-component system CitB family sensor kinase
VQVSIVEDEDVLTVRVEDNGPGIAAGERELVFVDGYTTKPDRGPVHRGLGLALVYRLVHRLHGSVTVGDGPGAVFVVTLPRVSRPVPVVEAVAG